MAYNDELCSTSMALTVNRPARLSPEVYRRGRLSCTLQAAQLLPQSAFGAACGR